MIKPQRYKILYKGTNVFAEKLIKSFNSYLRVVGFFFFYLSFTNNEKNLASFLDIRKHGLVVGNIHHAF